MRRHARFRRADRRSVEDVDLRLDDVDARDLLGHGVLDLDARIDLDEVELAGVGIHQELDRAGADVIRRPGDLQRMAAQFGALRFVEIGRGGALDDLLVAPLDRAVAFEQVHGVAAGVAEHLHLDVARPLDELLQIDLVLAEGGLRLALGLHYLARQVRFRADGAHAAAAAAPGRLQHHRIADLGRHPGNRRRIVGQGFGRRYDGDAYLDRQVAGGDLVAQPAHRLRRRPDEDDAGRRAGFGELRALRQEAVARMNGVGARQLGDADRLGDRQVAFDRSEIALQMRAAADLVALVRLEPVQRVLVLLRPDRDRPDAQFVRRAKNADGDLGAVGDEDLGDRQGRLRVLKVGVHDCIARKCCTANRITPQCSID